MAIYLVQAPLDEREKGEKIGFVHPALLERP
jgi:hypothetical protein